GLAAASLHDAIERALGQRARFLPERQRASVARFEGSNIARATIARYRAAIDAHGRKAGDNDAVSEDALANAPTFQAPFVIGLNRRLAEQRLVGLPAPLRALLVLATRTTKAQAEAGAREPGESAVGRLIEVDLEGEYRARLAELGAPPGVRW